MSVQGRYNPETDRTELKSAGVRRALAARLGQKLDPAEDPGPVDFSSPETGKALEAMFSERFGADDLKALKAEQKAAFEKAKKDAAAAKTAGARRRSSKKIRGSSPRIYSDASRRPSRPTMRPWQSWPTPGRKPSSPS